MTTTIGTNQALGTSHAAAVSKAVELVHNRMRDESAIAAALRLMGSELPKHQLLHAVRGALKFWKVGSDGQA